MHPGRGQDTASRQVAWCVRHRGVQDYMPVWEAMKDFTEHRDAATPDELWLLQHPPVFTLGQAGRREHLLDPGDIPIVRTDRGGQVTFHGPGQLIAYTLIDLRRIGFGVRGLVQQLEQGVIALLARYGVRGERRSAAPGVYVTGRKIASLGLRVRRGCCYHGLSINVDMDLEPFRRINPCGFPGLEVTQLADLGARVDPEQIGSDLARMLTRTFGYTTRKEPTGPQLR